jgi:acylaminoacyl-peptidase
MNLKEKKFIVLSHSGPHVMETNKFHRNAILFVKCGYSVAFVNYRESVGYPFDVIKSLIGDVGEQDVSEVIEVIRKLRKKYYPEKIRFYGHSHGCFIALHVTDQYSNEVDLLIAGAPLTNFVSHYYSVDIPDLVLVESGVKTKADGESEMNQEILNQFWSVSPIRHVSKVNVPVLLVHRRNERRVPYQQSVDMFNGLKRYQEKIGLLLYSQNNYSILVESLYNDYLVSVISFFEDTYSFLRNLDETL